MKAMKYVMTEEMLSTYHFLTCEGQELLGLVVDGTLVGHVEYHDDGDRELFIEMIEVEEPFQKQGYSTFLLDKLRELHPDILAFTGESTPEAVSFWKSKNVQFYPGVLHSYSPDNLEVLDEEGEIYAFAYALSTDYLPYWEHKKEA